MARRMGRQVVAVVLEVEVEVVVVMVAEQRPIRAAVSTRPIR
jgi:hypothetical protein